MRAGRCVFLFFAVPSLAVEEEESVKRGGVSVERKEKKEKNSPHSHFFSPSLPPPNLFFFFLFPAGFRHGSSEPQPRRPSVARPAHPGGGKEMDRAKEREERKRERIELLNLNRKKNHSIIRTAPRVRKSSTRSSRSAAARRSSMSSTRSVL